jgi:hypothetical protein
LAAGGWTRRDGWLERARLGAGAHRQSTPIGDRTLVPVPTADLVVSAHTTDAPNITVSMPVGMPPVVAELVMPALPLIARVTRNRRARPKPGRSDEGTATEESYVWARATSSDGEAVEAWARTGEGYAYTARAAVLAVEATLQSEPLGATTVARAFGPELSFNAGSELVAAA